MSNVAAVVPTCRGFTIPQQTIPVDWYIVHDREEREVGGKPARNIVAPDPGMYGKRCDSIRSAGFLQAYLDGAEYILTVDDDCEVPLDWAEQHAAALQSLHHPWNVTSEPAWPVRGLPRMLTDQVAISHGLWDGVPDLAAKDQLLREVSEGNILVRHDNIWRKIAAPFPQSAMNLGFRREVTAAMYQPFQGEDTPFDRFADIWGGLFAQKVLHPYYTFMNGGACVYHKRASDARVNLEKETPGQEMHDKLWTWVWGKELSGATLSDKYKDLAYHVERFEAFGPHKDYFKQLGTNMCRWADLTNES